MLSFLQIEYLSTLRVVEERFMKNRIYTDNQKNEP